METDTIVVMIALFGLNYGAMFVVYRRVSDFATTLKILCREHAQNHGDTEIKCD